LSEESGGLRKRRVNKSQTGEEEEVVQPQLGEGFIIQSIKEDRVWLGSAEADRLQFEESQRTSREAKEAQEKVTKESNRFFQN
jgi:hypothetical protein